MMEATSLLSLPEGMQIEQIQITENGLVIEVVATSPTSCCPLCSQPSSSIHWNSCRVLRDVPRAGRRVQLVLTVRKCSCRNPTCERKVFAERFPAFVEPRARATIRFCEQITSIGLSTYGKGGAKLATRLGIQTSRQAILRRIMDLPDVLTGSVLFLGIDDFAFRRGYCFGTILVNLESRRGVDLLASSGSGNRSGLDAKTSRALRGESGSWRGIRKSRDAWRSPGHAVCRQVSCREAFDGGHPSALGTLSGANPGGIGPGGVQ
jgi:transposase